MPRYTLLPYWPTDQDTLGFNEAGIGPEKWPEDWHPNRTEDIHAYAFPTPYAQAEAAATFIRLAQGRGLPEHFQDLVLGLVLGYLELGLKNLARDAGVFGKTLLTGEADMPFLGLLRATKLLAEGPGSTVPEGRLFGATHPRSLFWPHARAASFPGDWNELANRIANDPRRSDAMQLLCDFRKVLVDNGLWEDRVPWMLALNKIIPESAEPSDEGRTLRLSSRFAGPLPLLVRDGRVESVYFPVLHDDFARLFLRAVTGGFEEDAENERIVFFNSRSDPWAFLSLPRFREETPASGVSAAPARGAAEGARGRIPAFLAAGGGVVSPAGGAPEWERGGFNLHESRGGGGRGFFSLLSPLYAALTDNLDPEIIRRNPLLYPDPVRILVDRLGALGVATDRRVSLSPGLVERIIDSDEGLPDLDSFKGDKAGSLGAVIKVRGPDGKDMDVLYVESLEGREVGDLTAFGLLLWEVFTGAAVVEGERTIQNDPDAMDGVSMDLVEKRADRPISPLGSYYDKVLGAKAGDVRRKTAERLATLQRFVRAYKSVPDGPLAELAAKSAAAFARFARPDVIPNGPFLGSWKEVRLTGGLVLPVCAE